ncbi:class I SAM-dependent methyltransferase [Chloroflexota bacterium]
MTLSKIEKLERPHWLACLVWVLRKPAKFDYLDKWLSVPNTTILDVGCGNHSPFLTKKTYPNCHYWGVDITKDYNLDPLDFDCMDGFYELDITNISNLSVIENDFFDCIIMSHIVEHTMNGEEVILCLLNKLKNGGILYLEFPSPHSVYLPHMRGTLNFHDDPTHVRLYTVKELELLLTKSRCVIIRSGMRHILKRILLMPVYMVGSLILRRYLVASTFWDITGFCSYLIASKGYDSNA